MRLNVQQETVLVISLMYKKCLMVLGYVYRRRLLDVKRKTTVDISSQSSGYGIKTVFLTRAADLSLNAQHSISIRVYT